MKKINYALLLLSLILTATAPLPARAQETDAELCTITVDLPAGFEDCIYTIFNRTTGKFLPLEEGKVHAAKESVLKFNFKKDDWTYSSFTLDGKELDFITSSFDGSVYVEFTVTGDAVFAVHGTTTVYSDIDITFYVYDPEGVVLTPTTYHGTPAEMGEGAPVDADITLSSPDFVMTAAETRKFVLPVSSKRPIFFIAPKEGYFIYTVQGEDEGKITEVNNANASLYGTTYYIVARRMDNWYEAEVDLQVDPSHVSLRANTRLSMLWDNPSTRYTLVEGKQTIRFIPEYDLPLSVNVYDAPAGLGVYLDGLPVQPDVYGVYQGIEPYWPKSPQDPDKVSVITIGTTRPSSVESLDAEESVTVVGIDGRLILDKAPAAELRSLDKGLYIINGKKTIKQ